MKRSATSLLLLAFAVLLTGCFGGGRVAEKYRVDGKLQKWSDADWAKVLDQVATDKGFVRWDDIEANKNGVRDTLFQYVGQIGAASPENRPDLFATKKDQLAYYMNAYNALCMYGVVKRGYPSSLRVTSLDPGGLYQIDKFRVGGSNTTLNGLERVHVREFSGLDPRVHFALNCMSYSCPPLRSEPYVGDKLADQLQDQAHTYLSDPRAVKDEGDGKVEMNAIFMSYYDSDFIDAAKSRGEKAPSIVEAVRYYAAKDSPLQTATSAGNLGYDWSLNRPPEQFPKR